MFKACQVDKVHLITDPKRVFNNFLY